MAGAATALAQGTLTDSGSLLRAIGIVTVAAITFYERVWKPTAIAPAIERMTSPAASEPACGGLVQDASIRTVPDDVDRDGGRGDHSASDRADLPPGQFLMFRGPTADITLIDDYTLDGLAITADGNVREEDDRG